MCKQESRVLNNCLTFAVLGPERSNSSLTSYLGKRKRMIIFVGL